MTRRHADTPRTAAVNLSGGAGGCITVVVVVYTVSAGCNSLETSSKSDSIQTQSPLQACLGVSPHQAQSPLQACLGVSPHQTQSPLQACLRVSPHLYLVWLLMWLLVWLSYRVMGLASASTASRTQCEVAGLYHELKQGA